MPKGFVGRASETYLTKMNDALSVATEEHILDPFRHISRSVVPPPPLPARPNQNLPFRPEEARSGSFITGVGNSGNIVTDDQNYQEILWRINQADEKIAHVFYQTAIQTKEMCDTSFIVPLTTARCLLVLGLVETSLGDFRSLTDESLIRMRQFVDQIIAVG